MFYTNYIIALYIVSGFIIFSKVFFSFFGSWYNLIYLSLPTKLFFLRTIYKSENIMINVHFCQFVKFFLNPHESLFIVEFSYVCRVNLGDRIYMCNFFLDVKKKYVHAKIYVIIQDKKIC